MKFFQFCGGVFQSYRTGFPKMPGRTKMPFLYRCHPPQMLKHLYHHGIDRHVPGLDDHSAMLDIAKRNPDIKIDENQLRKLLRIAPEVIENMSQAEAVYFEMLMNGDLEILNNKTFRDMVIAIMSGHLQKHPNDMERVLAVFERDSVPNEIMQKYASYSKNER